MNIQHQMQWERDIEGAKELQREIDRLETENCRLQKVQDAAEKVYQTRHRVHDVDERADFYSDIITLGYALKVAAGQMPDTDEYSTCPRCGTKKRNGEMRICCM